MPSASDVDIDKKTIEVGLSSRRAFWLTAALAFFIACVMFIPPLIADGGMLTLHGDFDEQQIAFNMHSNDLIKAGRWGWDWSVDLGSSFVGAFGFYTLGSPFFWLSALFPANAFPFLVGWLYILKYVVAAMAAFIFVKHYVRKRETAVIVSLLYAFSGFSQIDLLFYHFHEVIALFPLLLWSLDRLVLDKKRGYFALFIGLSAVLNYFFFVGEMLFVLLYFIFRHLPTLKREARLGKIFAACVIEGVAGVLLAGILLLPSFLLVLRNPRTTGVTFSFENMVFPLSRYLAFLKGLSLPAETMAGQAAFIQNDFSSNALYLPLFGPALLYPVRKGEALWLKRLLLVCLLIALIPFLNSAFYGFTLQYYARWFYMPLLMMAILTGKHLERLTRRALYRGYAMSAGLLVFLIIAALFLQPAANMSHFRPDRLWLLILIATLGLLFSFLILVPGRLNTKEKSYLILTAVVLFSAVTGTLGVQLLRHDRASKVLPDDKYFEYKARLAGTNAVPAGADNMRFMLNRQVTNLPTMIDGASINSFISTISPSLFSFYEAIGNRRYVSTNVYTYTEPLLASLSVDRVLTRHAGAERTLRDFPSLKHTGSWQADKETMQQFHLPYAVPLGFTHTHYLPRSQFVKQPVETRHQLLLKALIVEDSDVPLVEKILTLLPESSLIDTDWQTAAATRREQAPQSFTRDADGFNAVYQLEGERFAWFSVPHEPGWRAFVNEQEVPIIDALSLMAIYIPEGKSTVRFSYETPGLKRGLVLSVVGLIFCGYLLFLNRKEKSRHSKDSR